VRSLLDLLADACCVEIPAAGHLPCVEQPDQFSGIMMRFFKENAYAG
jgi:hypothetical protein